MPTTMRANGWRPDRPDHRDFLYSDLRPQSRVRKALARSWSTTYLHEDNLPQIYNQGSIGSCVGHGVTEAAAFAIDFIYEGKDGRKPTDYSRLFTYYNAREHKDIDEGAYIRDGVSGIVRFGLCEEKFWPYDQTRWAVKPSPEAYRMAAHRAGNVAYFRIETLGDMLDCISQGFPIVYGMTLFASFDYVGLNGEVRMPKSAEKVVGGHCMLMVGYSMKKRAFYVRNSWGPEWGTRGHCWVPFEYIEAFADDFWTIRRLER